MSANPAKHQTLDQRRAAHAWEAIANIKSRPEDAKAFRGQAKKLPMRIHAAGLGHALAFVREKGTAPELLRELGHWVLDKRSNPQSPASKPDDSALLNRIVEEDARFLRRATEEALAYLIWLNRFAAVELPDTDDEN